MRAPRPPNTLSDLRGARLGERACSASAMSNKMDISNVVFPRSLLKEFIIMYGNSPCLWNRECSTYKNKKKRHDAITSLTELVQRFDPRATRVHVLRKIESLRACVRREHKRVVESRLSQAEEQYVPQLWYYDLFSFIFNEDGQNGNDYKIKTDTNDQSAESEDDQEEILGDEEPAFETHSYPDYTSLAVDMNDSSSSKGFVNYTTEEQGSQKSGKRQWTEVEDEYDAIGINVAAKLRNLAPNMRIIAEKLINDVLFQAQLNGLNSSTVLSTSDPFKQDVS